MKKLILLLLIVIIVGFFSKDIYLVIKLIGYFAFFGLLLDLEGFYLETSMMAETTIIMVSNNAVFGNN